MLLHFSWYVSPVNCLTYFVINPYAVNFCELTTHLLFFPKVNASTVHMVTYFPIQGAPPVAVIKPRIWIKPHRGRCYSLERWEHTEVLRRHLTLQPWHIICIFHNSTSVQMYWNNHWHRPLFLLTSPLRFRKLLSIVKTCPS